MQFTMTDMVKTLIEIEGEIEKRQEEKEDLDADAEHLLWAKLGVHRAYEHLSKVKDTSALKLVK